MKDRAVINASAEDKQIAEANIDTPVPFCHRQMTTNLTEDHGKCEGNECAIFHMERNQCGELTTAQAMSKLAQSLSKYSVEVPDGDEELYEELQKCHRKVSTIPGGYCIGDDCAFYDNAFDHCGDMSAILQLDEIKGLLDDIKNSLNTIALAASLM